MTPSDWAGLVLTILSILGIYMAGLRWFVRTEVRNVVHEEVRKIIHEEVRVIKHELSNNGGSSTKDKIDFIYAKMKEA